jgi:thymidine phosphorylase
MKSPEDARVLAETCTALAADWGRSCRAAVTDMSQPLGEAIGNALDVAEAVTLLSGGSHGRLRDLSVLFGGEAQSRLTGIGMGEGRSAAAAAIDSGKALEAFRLMVEAQGGDPRVVDDPWAVLPMAPVRRPIEADRAGHLAAVDAEALGRASTDLGAGRMKKGDPVDPAVGIVFRPKIGDRLEKGEEIGTIHARDEAAARAVLARVLSALTLSESRVEPPPLVHGWYGG